MLQIQEDPVHATKANTKLELKLKLRACLPGPHPYSQVAYPLSLPLHRTLEAEPIDHLRTPAESRRTDPSNNNLNQHQVNG